MPLDGNDRKLFRGVLDGDLDVVKAALEAGTNINGSPEQEVPPIVGAVMAEDVGILDFLLAQGADPNRPVTIELPGPSGPIATPGERALQIAASTGQADLVRCLLKRSRADPNATDNRGCTPLLATSKSSQDNVGVVRLLLEAGADPSLSDENGTIPLHLAAVKDDMDLLDMLYTAAPATLNRCSFEVETPLFLACANGHGSMVSKLLLLGAMQPLALDHGSAVCPLSMAVFKGFVGVVRVLTNEGGMRAVGGKKAFAKAMYVAIGTRQARILRLLLTVDGEERRSEWANIKFEGIHLLHNGAGYCCPAAVSVLLEAGADESAGDPEGRIPRDLIGVDIARDDEIQMDRGKEIAIRRMLERGPAYRARSWAWPSSEQAGAGGSGDGDTTAAAAAATADVLSFSPAMKTPPVISVRIFRPKEESSSKLFVRLVGRYCAKG